MPIPASAPAGFPRHCAPAVLLPLLLLALACPRAAAPTLRVGLVTYEAGLNGSATSNAVALAVDEVNRQGGLLLAGRRRRIELRPAVITEGSPEAAVAAVQKLINQEKVCAILGPQNSEEAIPAGGLANRSGIPLISPLSSLALTTRERPFVFRACFRDAVQGWALAVFARETLKARTAALLVEHRIAYSLTVADAFRREFTAGGGRIVVDASFAQASDDLAQPLQRIRRAAPDVLFMPNYQSTALPVGIAARRAGIRATFLGSDSWSPRHLGGVAEFDGAYMAANWSPDQDTPGNAAFTAAYTARFAVAPSETAALTYDAARMLFAAIAASADGSPDAIRKALFRPEGFQGISGPIRYLDSGDPMKQVVMLQFRQGRAALARVLAPGTGR